MNMTCPSCHKVCRPRAKFCNHCLQSFAGLTPCGTCHSLNPTGEACRQCEQQTIAEEPAFGSIAGGSVKRSQKTAVPTAAGRQRRGFVVPVVALLAVVLVAGYAWFSLGTGAWTRAGLAAAASATAEAAAAAAKAAAPPIAKVSDADMLTEMKDPEPEPPPAPEPAPRPVPVKRVPAPAPAPVVSTPMPAPPPEVIAPPAAPEPLPAPKPAVRAKTVDEVFNERLSAECSSGIGGLICREKLRYAVCADRWSQSPPPGQTICRGNPTN